MDRGLDGDGFEVTQSAGWSSTRSSSGWGVLALWLLPLLYLAVFFFTPLVSVFQLAAEAEVESGPQADLWGHISGPLGFTFYQAALSTLATLVVGLPAAYVFGRYNFKGKSLLRVLTTLPFILPTVVVAAAFRIEEARPASASWSNWVRG